MINHLKDILGIWSLLLIFSIVLFQLVKSILLQSYLSMEAKR